MNRKISFEIIERKNGDVKFKISNSHRWVDLTPDGNIFKASNGITLRSIGFPYVSGRILFLQGKSHGSDGIIVSANEELFSMYVAAIEEYNTEYMPSILTV